MLEKDEQFEACMILQQLQDELRFKKRSLGELLDTALDEEIMKRPFADTYDSYYLYVPW